MPYTKPGEMVEAQRVIREYLSNMEVDKVHDDIDALESFLHRHPVSGDYSDDSRFAKVDGVWVREDSIEDADWQTPAGEG